MVDAVYSHFLPLSIETGSLLGPRVCSLLYSDWLDSKSHGGPPFLMSPTLSLEESLFLCECWNMSLGLNVYVADLFEMYTCIYMSLNPSYVVMP